MTTFRVVSRPRAYDAETVLAVGLTLAEAEDLRETIVDANTTARTAVDVDDFAFRIMRIK